jgi:hypothetical protein
MIEYTKTNNIQSFAEAQAVKGAFQYPPSEAPLWPAVRALLQHPWFSRVWTFREIVLAQQATIYCGAHSLK